jgi:hypothetical protein
VSVRDQAKTVVMLAVGVVLAVILAAWLWYDPRGLAHVAAAAGRGIGHGAGALWSHVADVFRN